MTSVDSQRKIDRGGLQPGCPVRTTPDGTWLVQDYATARELLRRTDTKQAGFGIEGAMRFNNKVRMPVLYRDGPEHRDHRRQTAKYFTPRRVDSTYRDLMHRLAEEQCEVLRRKGTADLTDLSFRLAVAVAGEVVGLTDSRGDMAKRINRFFGDLPDPTATGLRALRYHLRSAYIFGAFYLRDVRPNAARRRKERRDDLLSHLIDEGCSDAELLGECVTFAAAGMVTTREFITVVAWHLFSDEALKTEYLTADEPHRHRILHEILRLEPVVDTLKRWTTEDIRVGDQTIPAGARLDLGVAAANADPSAVGPDPESVCPARPLSDGVADAGLSFGDGAHRCPGAYIAIQETDIFLMKLFALPGLRMSGTPTVEIRPDIASYEVKGLRVTIDRP